MDLKGYSFPLISLSRTKLVYLLFHSLWPNSFVCTQNILPPVGSHICYFLSVPINWQVGDRQIKWKEELLGDLLSSLNVWHSVIICWQ